MFPFCAQTFDILPADAALGRRVCGEGVQVETGRQAMPTPSGQLDRHSTRGDATRLQIQPEAQLALLLLLLLLNLSRSLPASLSAAASNVSLCVPVWRVWNSNGLEVERKEQPTAFAANEAATTTTTAWRTCNLFWRCLQWFQPQVSGVQATKLIS